MFRGLDVYYTDPAHLISAGYDLDDLCRDLSDLSDLSVRRVQGFLYMRFPIHACRL